MRNFFFREIHQGWGTAVYLQGIQSGNEIEFHQYPQRIVAREIHLPLGETLLLASIHAPIINGRVFPHLANIFDEIETRFAKHSCIIGGDLNSARLAEKVWPGYGHGPFFERIDQSWLLLIHA